MISEYVFPNANFSIYALHSSLLHTEDDWSESKRLLFIKLSKRL